MDHLTEGERNLIKSFLANEQMVTAVRKVMNDGVCTQGTPDHQHRNWVFGIDAAGTMNNEQFGEAVRVHADALVLVDRAFTNMRLVLEPTEKKEPKNKAR